MSFLSEAFDISDSTKRMIQFLCFFDNKEGEKLNVRTTNYQSIFEENKQILNFFYVKERFRTIIHAFAKEDPDMAKNSFLEKVISYVDNTLE